jgi:hypothetical protein
MLLFYPKLDVSLHERVRPSYTILQTKDAEMQTMFWPWQKVYKGFFVLRLSLKHVLSLLQTRWCWCPWAFSSAPKDRLCSHMRA